MKKRWILLVAIVAALAAGRGLLAEKGMAQEKDAKQEFQATCPVSGQPAKETAFLEHNGKKVYFCCMNCPKAFAKDPKKFATKVNYQLIETDQVVQVACPIAGRKINPETAEEFAGTKVAFCCEKCQGKFNAASDEQKVTLICADITKGFTLQTECPVSGKPIKAEHVVEHKGKKVYFCCPNCPAAFEKNPEKFTAKLPQFAEPATK